MRIGHSVVMQHLRNSINSDHDIDLHGLILMQKWSKNFLLLVTASPFVQLFQRLDNYFKFQ